MDKVKEFITKLINRIWDLLSKYLGRHEPEVTEIDTTVSTITVRRLENADDGDDCCGGDCGCDGNCGDECKCKDEEGVCVCGDECCEAKDVKVVEIKEADIFKEVEEILEKAHDRDYETEDHGDGYYSIHEFSKKERAKMRKVYHVVPNPKGGWLVKEQNNKNPSARTDRKPDAVKRAKELAKKAKLGQVIVHKKNGQIQTEYTYGKDPKSTKG